MNEEAMTPDKEQVVEPLTAEDFWRTHCNDCGHDLHPMNMCSAIVGGDQNGPDYCPCAIDYPALAAEYQRAARTASVAGLDRYYRAEPLGDDDDGWVVCRGANRVLVVADEAEASRVVSGLNADLFHAAPSIEQEPGEVEVGEPSWLSRVGGSDDDGLSTARTGPAPMGMPVRQDGARDRSEADARDAVPDLSGVVLPLAGERGEPEANDLNPYGLPVSEGRSRRLPEPALREQEPGETLRAAALALVEAMEANRDAINGGGHDGPHDRVLHHDPCTDLPGVAHVYSLTDDCAQCGGAQYGSDDDLHKATGDLRRTLGLPVRPWEERAALEADRNPQETERAVRLCRRRAGDGEECGLPYGHDEPHHPRARVFNPVQFDADLAAMEDDY